MIVKDDTRYETHSSSPEHTKQNGSKRNGKKQRDRICLLSNHADIQEAQLSKRQRDD